MATKKKATKKAAPKKKRRMSGMKKPANLETALYALGGALIVKFGAGKLFDMVDKDAKIKPALRGAIIAGLGYGLPMVFPKNKMLEDVSLGVMVAGGISVAQGMGWISGINDTSTPLIAAYKRISGQNRQLAAPPQRQTTMTPSVAGYGRYGSDRGSRYSYNRSTSNR